MKKPPRSSGYSAMLSTRIASSVGTLKGILAKVQPEPRLLTTLTGGAELPKR